MGIKLVLLLCLVSELRAVPLLISWTTSLKLIESERPGNVINASPTTTLAIGVDYHLRRGEYYFSDGLGRILRGWLRKQPSNISQPIIIAEVKLVDGLAVDWIHDYLYWTDITKKIIEMSTLDGLYRRTLFNSTHGLDKPRGIVLDPFEGLLFWSDWGDDAKVESSGLDGKEKQTIVNRDLRWPNGLTLDLDTKVVYILDGSSTSILSCNYDGSNLQTIEQDPFQMLQAFGLTFYKGKLFWDSWRNHILYSMEIESKRSSIVYRNTGWQSTSERMMGVKAIHDSLQRAVSSPDPCASAGCSHRCQVGRRLTTSCICPYGHRLLTDRKTCVEEAYLLMSWTRTIRKYSLNGTNEEPMIDGTNGAISLDYHYKKHLVFWSDIQEHRIYRAPLGQLNNKTAIASPETCDGLAIDWVHDVIYWTDTATNTLEAAALDGSKHMVVFSENLDEPRAIVLDPISGLLFWTDWGTSPKIERAVLDGTSRKTIISQDIVWPNGLTIDFVEKRILFVDGKLKTISSCLFDGTQRTEILPAQTYLERLFSISIIQDEIYLADWNTLAIYKTHKKVPNKMERLATSSTVLLRPHGMKVVHSSLQEEGENSCASINCQDLCLGTADPHRGHCMGEQTKATLEPENKPEKETLTSKVSNSSIEILLHTNNPPSMVVITVKCMGRVDCGNNVGCTDKADIVLPFFNQTLSYNIGGLLPATRYTVDFKSTGHSEQLQLTTTVTDPPEVPKFILAVVNKKSVTLKWKPVDTCAPTFNSYNYKLFAAYASTQKGLTDQEVVVEDGSTFSTETLINDLEPDNYTARVYTNDPTRFSSITFTIQDDNEILPCMKEEFLCDGKEDCSDGSDEGIATCAGIEEITVYKKDSSSIYFRCQVTNGTKKGLDKFIVSYNPTYSTRTNSSQKVATACVMWTESYCFSISSLTKNQEYVFSISAALKSGQVGKKYSVSAITKEGAPGPPEDVHVVNYTPTTVSIEVHHPNQSNGIIKNFIVNVQELERYEEDKCCQSFPILETLVTGEESTYSIVTGGFTPASSYAISISAKTLYVGQSTSIDTYTPPPPMDIQRHPNVLVHSVRSLSWQPPQEPPYPEQTLYFKLIKEYLLLVLPTKKFQPINVTNPDLGPLQAVLEYQIGVGFTVVWRKNVDDAEAFQQPIKLTELQPMAEYTLAWVQVSQYKEAYGVDYILSDPFTAL